MEIICTVKCKIRPVLQITYIFTWDWERDPRHANSTFPVTYQIVTTNTHTSPTFEMVFVFTVAPVAVLENVPTLSNELSKTNIYYDNQVTEKSSS